MTIHRSSISFTTMSIHSAGPGQSFQSLIPKSTKAWEDKALTPPREAGVTF